MVLPDILEIHVQFELLSACLIKFGRINTGYF